MLPCIPRGTRALAQGNDAGNEATFVLLCRERCGDNSLAAGRDALLGHGYDYEDHSWVRDKCFLVASLFCGFCFCSFEHKLKTPCKAVCFWYSLFVVLIQGVLMDYKGPSGAKGEEHMSPSSQVLHCCSSNLPIPWVTAYFWKAALCHGNRHESCWEHHLREWAFAVYYGIATWCNPWSADVCYQCPEETGAAAIGWNRELEANAGTVANFSAFSMKPDVVAEIRLAMPRVLFGFPVWGKLGLVEFVCFARILYQVRSCQTEMEEGEI